MAQIPKKTYSRRANTFHEISESKQLDKENVDPFDKLLESPLKQDVMFKPLSFWKSQEKCSNKKKCDSYELSDSDESFSPDKRTIQLKQKALKQRKVKNFKINSLENSRNVPKVDKFNNSENDSMGLQTSNKDFIFVSKRKNYKKFFRGNFNVLMSSSQAHSKSMQTKRIPVKPEKSFQHLNLLNNNLNTTEEIKNYYINSNNQETTLSGNSVINPSFEYTKLQDQERQFPNLINVTFSLTNLNKNSEEKKSSMKCEMDLLRSLKIPNKSSNNSIYMKPDCRMESCIFNSITEDELDVQNDADNSMSPTNSIYSNNIYSLECLMSDLTISNKNVISHKEEDPVEEVIEEKNDTLINCSPTLGRNNISTITGEKSLCNINSRKGLFKKQTISKSDSKLFNESNSGIFEETLKARELPVEIKKDEITNVCQKNFEEMINMEDKNDILDFSTNDKLNLDSSKYLSFTCPAFESTRIHDDECTENTKMRSNINLETTNITFYQPYMEKSIVLKSGKKWLRSISVLKQLQNRNFTDEDTKNNTVKGRNHENFVQELLNMQNDVSFLQNEKSDDTLRGETTIYESVNNISNEEFLSPKELSVQRKEVLNEDSIKKDPEYDHSKSFLCSTVTCETPESSVSHRPLMNYTVKVIDGDNTSSEASFFRSALGLKTDESLINNTVICNNTEKEENSTISAKDFILAQCEQTKVLPFNEYFNERTLKNCKKIGEGVYGEVFMSNFETVIKIIPIEGTDKVNGEPQKKFEEILSEIVIASKLSNLRKGEKFQTSGFSEMKRCWCVVGKYPKFLLDLWNEYDSDKGSENDSPIMFKDDQLYIILELANGGKDLESFVFNSSEQSLSVFIQTAASLAVAEQAFDFEHRDLHWGNILIAPTKDKFVSVCLNGVEFKIATKGVKVSIIDFTLSRISHEGCCIFNDLSVDPSLFASQGDYQFEIYRMMQREVKNDWSLFKPRNNIYWLHYVADKMIKLVRYKNKNTQVHKKFIKNLKILESVILKYDDSMNFVLSEGLIG